MKLSYARRRKQARKLSAVLGAGGFIDASAGSVRWLISDPTKGLDPDWNGEGFYARDGEGIRFLGVSKAGAYRIIQQIKEPLRKARKKLAAPERRARRMNTMSDFLSLVTKHGPSIVKTGIGIRKTVKHR